jgi:hypothetical protein
MSKLINLKVSEIVSFRTVLFQLDCIVDEINDNTDMFNEMIKDNEIPENAINTFEVLKAFNKKLDETIHKKIKALKYKTKDIKSYSVSIKDNEISALRELNLLDEFIWNCIDCEIIENSSDLEISIKELNETVEKIISK